MIINLSMPTISGDVRRTQHQEFDFASFREVPDSHVWSDVNDNPSRDAAAGGPDAVPVIDLLHPDASRLIGLACESWGAFHVTGHGVPAAIIDRAAFHSCRLFSLPPKQKLKAVRPPDGVAGFTRPRIAAFYPKHMWLEGFTISGSPAHHARLLFSDEEHLHFCEAMKEYSEEMEKVAMKLMKLLLESLESNYDDLGWDGPMKFALQLNSYPACPNPDRAMGLAPHTDSSVFTVLHQSSPGLQLLRPGDEFGPARWVTVPLVGDALVVNVGDLTHILSNGRYRSVRHRAVVDQKTHRYSLAYFCGPPARAEVGPLVGGKRAYIPVTWDKYLSLKATMFDGALDAIRAMDDGDNPCIE